MNDYQVKTVTEVWTARFLPAEGNQPGRWRIRGPERSKVVGNNETSSPYEASVPVGVMLESHTETLRDIVAVAAGGLVAYVKPATVDDADPIGGWNPTERLTVVRPVSS